MHPSCSTPDRRCCVRLTDQDARILEYYTQLLPIPPGPLAGIADTQLRALAGFRSAAQPSPALPEPNQNDARSNPLPCSSQVGKERARAPRLWKISSSRGPTNVPDMAERGRGGCGGRTCDMPLLQALHSSGFTSCMYIYFGGCTGLKMHGLYACSENFTAKAPAQSR